MEVYKVTESQMRAWIRSPWDTDIRYKFAAGLNDYPMSGDFVIVGCSSWYGSFDASMDEGQISFGSVTVVKTLSRARKLVDGAYDVRLKNMRKGLSEFAMEWEIWAVVDDDLYSTNDDDNNDDDNVKPCHVIEVAFSDMWSVMDYVRTAIGDEYAHEFDIQSIARNLVNYDKRCHHFLIKPIYRGCHVNQLTNNNFWNLVYAFDYRRTADWFDLDF